MIAGFDRGTTRRARALAFALAFTLAACAAPTHTVEDPAARMPREATRVFGTVYEQVSDRYLRPVSIPDFANDGLAAVAALDPALTLRRDGDGLEVAGGGVPMWRANVTTPDQPRAWARATVAAIEVARERSPALRERSPDQIYQTFFDAALKRLDIYTRYSEPDSARDQRAQREGFGGIGVTIDASGGAVRVASVVEDTPAARGGLRVDDRITAIEGTATAGMATRDVVRRLRGRAGDPVSIELTRPGVEPPFGVTLVREHITPQTVAWRRAGDVAIIRLTSFNSRTAELLTDAIGQAQREIGPRLAGIVLDLRGNLGGLLDQSITVADLFLAEGSIVSTRGRNNVILHSSTARPGGAGERLPLVVLVNGNSASASEIVAAALQDNDRAVVVGTTSFGKGSVQTVIPLANDAELALTSARFHGPSGYPLADLGVRPTICTSGGSEAPAAVVARVRAGRALEPELTRRWHEADHDDLEGLKALRATCAPESAERDSDVEIARALLADRALYATALPGRGRLAVAP